MKQVIPLIENDITFSPYYFYQDFLKRVSNFYQISYSHEDIQFKIVLESNFEFISKGYFIDPISLPLLLSLGQHLKKFQKKPIVLQLSNNPATINLLEFLYKADFFHLAGKNQNPGFPLGKDIFSFEEAYLGGFKGKNQRSEHKIRCYSLRDDNLIFKLKEVDKEESKRDLLVEHYGYKVQDHFFVLLNENPNTRHLTGIFIDILAELIANGVLHSESDAFVLMFSDRFKTKFSISDSGIGLHQSLSRKKDNHIYKKFSLLNELSLTFNLQVSDSIKLSLLSIFETLYFSMLKDRKGLFDLMCNVVINCKGYFRLHNENAQVIVSARMLKELEVLDNTRSEILNVHNLFLFDQIDKEKFDQRINELALTSKLQIVKLANFIFSKYTEDTRFSSIRLFEVKFRGVHIEVEIPNTNQEA